MLIRYIRDYCVGGSPFVSGSGGRWLQIAAWTPGNTPIVSTAYASYPALLQNVTRNRAFQCAVSSNKSGGNASVGRITDGFTLNHTFYFGNEEAGASQYVQVDLGSIVDIESVQVWHYGIHLTSFIWWNHRLLVSSDAVTWKTIQAPEGNWVENWSGATYFLFENPEGKVAKLQDYFLLKNAVIEARSERGATAVWDYTDSTTINYLNSTELQTKISAGLTVAPEYALPAQGAPIEGEDILDLMRQYFKIANNIATCTSGCVQQCQDSCIAMCYSSCNRGCGRSCSTMCYSSCSSSCGGAACSNTCGNSCSATCGSTCGTTCTANCYNACEVACAENACSTCSFFLCGSNCAHSCTGGCKITCSAACSTACGGCGYGCGSSCNGGCNAVCQANCGNACTHGCVATCNIGCKSVCSRGCENTCTGTCYTYCTAALM